jgi:hypothetical protein
VVWFSILALFFITFLFTWYYVIYQLPLSIIEIVFLFFYRGYFKRSTPSSRIKVMFMICIMNQVITIFGLTLFEFSLKFNRHPQTNLVVILVCLGASIVAYRQIIERYLDISKTY